MIAFRVRFGSPPASRRLDARRVALDDLNAQLIIDEMSEKPSSERSCCKGDHAKWRFRLARAYIYHNYPKFEELLEHLTSSTFFADSHHVACMNLPLSRALAMKGVHPLAIRCLERAGYDLSSITSSGSIVILEPTGERFFGKTGRNVAQTRGETESLLAMGKTTPDLVPKVIGFEVDESGKEAGIVSQYFDLTSFKGSEIHAELAREVARLHVPMGERRFGFDVPTFCGATEQDNTWAEEWMILFRDRRFGDLVRRIGDKEISTAWGTIRDR